MPFRFVNKNYNIIDFAYSIQYLLFLGLPKKDRFFEKYPVFLFKALGYGFLRVNYGKITGHKNENQFFLKLPGFWQEPSKNHVFHVQPEKK